MKCYEGEFKYNRKKLCSAVASHSIHCFHKPFEFRLQYENMTLLIILKVFPYPCDQQEQSDPKMTMFGTSKVCIKVTKKSSKRDDADYELKVAIIPRDVQGSILNSSVESTTGIILLTSNMNRYLLVLNNLLSHQEMLYSKSDMICFSVNATLIHKIPKGMVNKS